MGIKHDTVPVRLSYVNIVTPRSIQGSEPKYSVTLMFDKKNKDQMRDLRQIYDTMVKLTEEKWPNKKDRPKLPIQGHDSSFIKDADQACDGEGTPLLEKNPQYEGHYIINLYGKEAPYVMNNDKDRSTMDPSAIYSGCFCRVRCDLFAYAQPRKGITGSLVGFQWWCDGEPLGGYVPDNPEEAFTDGYTDDSVDPNFFGESKEGDHEFEQADEDIPF